MSYILSLDCSGDACSVALSDGHQLWHQHVICPQQHNALILKMIECSVMQAGITLHSIVAVALGAGTGSFTGVRIAAGVAQGLALALDIGIVPVMTLSILAQQAYRRFQCTQVLPCLDARMAEVYWCAHRLNQGVMQPEGEPSVLPPEHLLWQDCFAGYCTIGPGWQYDSLPKPYRALPQLDSAALPMAQDIDPLARRLYEQHAVVAAQAIQPIYVRNQVAYRNG